MDVAVRRPNIWTIALKWFYFSRYCARSLSLYFFFLMHLCNIVSPAISNELNLLNISRDGGAAIQHKIYGVKSCMYIEEKQKKKSHNKRYSKNVSVCICVKPVSNSMNIWPMRFTMRSFDGNAVQCNVEKTTTTTTTATNETDTKICFCYTTLSERCFFLLVSTDFYFQFWVHWISWTWQNTKPNGDACNNNDIHWFQQAENVHLGGFKQISKGKRGVNGIIQQSAEVWKPK